MLNIFSVEKKALTRFKNKKVLLLIQPQPISIPAAPSEYFERFFEATSSFPSWWPSAEKPTIFVCGSAARSADAVVTESYCRNSRRQKEFS